MPHRAEQRRLTDRDLVGSGDQRPVGSDRRPASRLRRAVRDERSERNGCRRGRGGQPGHRREDRREQPAWTESADGRFPGHRFWIRRTTEYLGTGPGTDGGVDGSGRDPVCGRHGQQSAGRHPLRLATELTGASWWGHPDLRWFAQQPPGDGAGPQRRRDHRERGRWQRRGDDPVGKAGGDSPDRSGGGRWRSVRAGHRPRWRMA